MFEVASALGTTGYSVGNGGVLSLSAIHDELWQTGHHFLHVHRTIWSVARRTRIVSGKGKKTLPTPEIKNFHLLTTCCIAQQTGTCSLIILRVPPLSEGQQPSAVISSPSRINSFRKTAVLFTPVSLRSIQSVGECLPPWSA